jgi:DNA-binding helix-hairpin-helix protein with protein kinase domain
MPDVVVDIAGSRYDLGAQLGSGGQGTVFAVPGRPLAVKVMHAANLADDLRCKENISRVRLLDLAGLNIARPKCALREPHVGYVMDLMTGMVPLRTLLRPPRSHLKDPGAWYRDTGGLLRRLRILSKLAVLLGDLHARGMVFGDASPNNVFVSEDVSHDEVWLIDADNITQGAGRSGLYTPGYGAPELVRRETQSDSLTDAWSLATMVFEVLACLHPFRDGVYVNEGEPELEHEADCGRVPWVDEETNPINNAVSGIARDKALTPALRTIASECFGGSRLDRNSRPGVSRWKGALSDASDQVVTCASCQQGYWVSQQRCSWCGAARPTVVRAVLFLRDLSLTDAKRNPGNLVAKEAGKPLPQSQTVIQAGRQTALTSRHFGFSDSDRVEVSATLRNGKLFLEGPESCRVHLWEYPKGPARDLAGRQVEVAFQNGGTAMWLVPADAGGINRVCRFQFLSEAAQ